MRLYHGSSLRIPRPDVTHSRPNLDFGQGFYLTSIQHQAERWALRKASFEDMRPIVNVFEFDEDLSGLSVLRFSDNDASWVDFVCRCRRGETANHGFDLIIGGVADDKVYEAVNMYFRGLWDLDTTLSALKFYERNDQYCFVTQTAVDERLVFVESYEVRP